MVGTTALMFHDRHVSLQKMKKLVPPLQTSQLDYSLWLARSPPEGLEHHRAAFIWWTSTHYKMRRLECHAEDCGFYINFHADYSPGLLLMHCTASLEGPFETLGGWPQISRAGCAVL